MRSLASSWFFLFVFSFLFFSSLFFFVFSLSLLSCLPIYSWVNHFFFASFVTLALLRRSCCILRGLRGTPWINILGQWLLRLKKFNRVRDFRLQQQQSKRFFSWLKPQNLSTMPTLPTSRHWRQSLLSRCLTSQKLKSSLAKIFVTSRNTFIPCWTCMELSSLFPLPNLMPQQMSVNFNNGFKPIRHVVTLC